MAGNIDSDNEQNNTNGIDQDELLTTQEIRFLILAESYINDPVNQHGVFPPNRWFENILSISKAGVSNLKASLSRKGIFEKENGRIQLTQKAWDFLKSPSRGVTSNLYILKPGQVSAGKAAGGELKVLASEITDLIEDTLTIPSPEPRGKIVAYEVVGDSMESEGIYQGDYVIVEINPRIALSDGKMIVAKYLLRDDEDGSELRGPTLKIYRGERKDAKGRFALLGRRRDYGQTNPYLIEAGSILPIGPVIGVYRVIN